LAQKRLASISSEHGVTIHPSIPSEPLPFFCSFPEKRILAPLISKLDIKYI